MKSYMGYFVEKNNLLPRPATLVSFGQGNRKKFPLIRNTNSNAKRTAVPITKSKSTEK
jgi:hypothetical protein